MSRLSQQDGQAEASSNEDPSSVEDEPLSRASGAPGGADTSRPAYSPIVPPPYVTSPTQRLELEESDGEDEEYNPVSALGAAPAFTVSRLVRARRNRIVLDALLDLLQRNEERMLQFVMDQSYHDSLQPRAPDMHRCLDVEKTLYANTESSCDACMICQESFQDEDQVALLECVHVLHFTCLEQWIKRKSVCPFCEADIPYTVKEEVDPSEPREAPLAEEA